MAKRSDEVRETPATAPAERTAETIDVLGGESDLCPLHESASSLPELVREGLPFAALESAMSTLSLSLAEMQRALRLPSRTLARRRQERRLSPDESDRLARLARVGARALQVLGDGEKASAWLHRPNRALCQRAPLDLLDTDPGTRQVEEVLGRIEQGVFS